jgi:glycosyltransferase involved in cell wall biosynthesis
LIYISIPVHNEGRTIGLLLWKIRKVMAEFGRPYEICVFDDASTDETPKVLSRYAGLIPLHQIRSDERVGYGRAIERLVRSVVDRSAYPKRDVMVTLQGDFTEDPEAIVVMVKKIEGGADLVAGNPSSVGAAVPAPVRACRRLAPIVLGRTFSRAPVKDSLSGFRAYRMIVLKKALRELQDDQMLLTSGGWGANLELLLRVAPYVRRIEEAEFAMGSFRRERASRFRAIQTLRTLVGLRGTVWPRTPERP